MEPDLVQLGKVVEEARSKAGLSLRDAAAAAGFSPAYFRAIEKASNPKTKKPSQPSVSNLRGIAAALSSLELRDLLDMAGYDAEEVLEAMEGDGAPAPRSAAALIKQLKDYSHELHERSPFMRELAHRRLEEFAAEYLRLTKGATDCSAADEPTLTMQALSQCKSTLRAVSFKDEVWWETGHGDRYMDLHRDLLERDVMISRIFITTKEDLPRLRTALERHCELEGLGDSADIRAAVVWAEDARATHARDFVIYDDELLRTAAEPDDPDVEEKRAHFTDQPWEVQMARRQFDDLERLAKTSGLSARAALLRLEET